MRQDTYFLSCCWEWLWRGKVPSLRVCCGIRSKSRLSDFSIRVQGIPFIGSFDIQRRFLTISLEYWVTVYCSKRRTLMGCTEIIFTCRIFTDNLLPRLFIGATTQIFSNFIIPTPAACAVPLSAHAKSSSASATLSPQSLQSARNCEYLHSIALCFSS